MLPIIQTLVGAGLNLLASAIQKKGKEFVEDKLGIKIPDEPTQLTPEKLQELKKAELEHEEELLKIALEEQKAYLKDTQNARKTFTDINKSERTPFLNKIFPSILAGITVLLTFGLFALFAFNNFEGAQKDIVIYILGVLSTITTQIFAFYFGSSMGSKEKTEIFKRFQL